MIITPSLGRAQTAQTTGGLARIHRRRRNPSRIRLGPKAGFILVRNLECNYILIDWRYEPNYHAFMKTWPRKSRASHLQHLPCSSPRF